MAVAELPPRPPIKRRLPRPSEIRPLLKLQAPDLSARRRRLAAAHTIEDLRRAALKQVPRSVFDYVDGGAEQEISIARSRAAF